MRLAKMKASPMKPTGIKVTPEELQVVKTAQTCSGMFLSGGWPMGNPEHEVYLLTLKYHPPEGSGLDLETGEFVLP